MDWICDNCGCQNEEYDYDCATCGQMIAHEFASWPRYPYCRIDGCARRPDDPIHVYIEGVE